MRAVRFLLLLLFMGSVACTMAHAAKRPDKPLQSAAAKGSGQIVCTRQGCRPVKKGCRVEIVGYYNEEVCN